MNYDPFPIREKIRTYFAPFSREHAAEHIAVLVEADKRGHYSHGGENSYQSLPELKLRKNISGFNRLRGHYVADIKSKVRNIIF